jgi:hypothetical protein
MGHGGVAHRIEAPVDPDDRAPRADEPDRLETLTAPEVEEPPLTEAFDNCPVTSFVKGEQ